MTQARQPEVPTSMPRYCFTGMARERAGMPLESGRHEVNWQAAGAKPEFEY
jgi:hypothetical protein